MTTKKLSQLELVILLALMFSAVAFSIDGMLPSLPQIGLELNSHNPTKSKGILIYFMLGIGIGTLFVGPLSDCFGRKRLLLIGCFVYILCSLIAFYAPSLDLILLARIFQGMAAAAPRIVSQAVIRDLYSGRSMARIQSFVFLVFTLVPAIAPLLGEQIMIWSGWRGIFFAFVCFGLLIFFWVGFRLQETLPVNKRIPLRLEFIIPKIQEIFSTKTVILSILVLSFAYACIFCSITFIQPVFDLDFGRADQFTLWFALIALVSGTASILNAKLVMHLGMRKLVYITLRAQIFFSSITLIYFYYSPQNENLNFFIYLFWQWSIFFQTGIILGNLNAIAMEPLGHIAGLAASIISGISTIAAAILVSFIALFFDGTAFSLILGMSFLVICAFFFFKPLNNTHLRD